ncbi:hypothetical protein CI088_15925 [Enterococcus plantarum]|uniref:Uncharacterized protein n=1 Tax=Enterococcus plantarum TaxID=1077675 RepID=A0A2W3YQB8_9ENTE|nr:hypothetical protein [Enterococcus plantarum]PZL70136.1 hypothetical protein CI088_15925 [Enterococcus plantarum]
MKKPINYLAQTGALEDLIWSIMNDAESEAHLDRYIESLQRDIKQTEDEQEADEINSEIEKSLEYKSNIRAVRYEKTYIALSIANKIAKKKQNDKYSCLFKHQLLSMAEMRDAKDAITDDSIREHVQNIYTRTVNNASIAISNFLGLEVESCMACLFEKNKIEKVNEK